MLNELPTKVQEDLLNFENSPYFKAYREYVLLHSGQCLGMLRAEDTTRDKDMFYKGMLKGLEMLTLDLFQQRASQGEEAFATANAQNRVYTQDLLEQPIKELPKM